MNCALSQDGYRPPTLDIAHLSKSFRNKQALTDVEFSVPSGSLTVILGPAGAGKTTMLRLIAGLETPDCGSITLSGKDALGLQPKDRDVAMIFDNIALYPNKTGYENIASPLQIRKEQKDEIEQKVTEVSNTLKISHILNRLPKTMSGGERQRIALGRALIRSPQIFLLDEPLSSLDAKLRIELRAELRRLQQELGYTFLLTTPDFQEAMAIADTVIMLREGRIVQIASPQELYDNPVDLEVARFIGAPQINVCKATIVAGCNKLQLIDSDLEVDLPSHLEHLSVAGPETFQVGIRPENIEVVSRDNGQFTARIVDIEPLGLKAILTLYNSGIEFRAIVSNSTTQAITLGEDLGVIIHPEKMLAFDTTATTRL
ncbi:ABC transporter ATP-binding protein [Desulfosediminicola sp.]|uniref:ABC transporter ATP-binding protein n=1 Tax=Desulfosediminicola sp. TaxID=2886825 RepID=UPI003AF263D0